MHTCSAGTHGAPTCAHWVGTHPCAHLHELMCLHAHPHVHTAQHPPPLPLPRASIRRYLAGLQALLAPHQQSCSFYLFLCCQAAPCCCFPVEHGGRGCTEPPGNGSKIKTCIFCPHVLIDMEPPALLSQAALPFPCGLPTSLLSLHQSPKPCTELVSLLIFFLIGISAESSN